MACRWSQLRCCGTWTGRGSPFQSAGVTGTRASATRQLNHMSMSAIDRTAFTWMAAVALAVFAPGLQAASFPCEKATTSVEKTICSAPELSTLDEYLGRYYAAARNRLQHAEDCLISDQRTWIRTVRDACKDSACLKTAYLERLSVLHAVQPGASSLRTIELPRTSSLVWIVPPAADQVAAPRNVRTNPLSVSGRIVNEVSAGDGYVLQSDGGEKHTIVSLMFLDQPTSDSLAQLAQVAGARYELRGRTDVAARGAKAFAASQCTFVYRGTR